MPFKKEYNDVVRGSPPRARNNDGQLLKEFLDNQKLHDVAKQEAAYNQDRRGYRKLRLKKNKVQADLAQS